MTPRHPWPLLSGALVLLITLAACGAAPASQAPPSAPSAEPTTAAEAPPSAPSAEPTTAAEVPTVTAATTRGQGDTLHLHWWQAANILNPHLSSGTKDIDASRATYEPLASFNAAGELVPFLAAEIPSVENGGVAADGKSVTWKLVGIR